MLGLMSGYKENRTLALTAVVIQSLMFLYWLGFLILSFLGIKAISRRVCIDNRCPDHLWIQDSRWRPFAGVCDPADLSLPQLSKTKGQAVSLIGKVANVSILNIINGENLSWGQIKPENTKLLKFEEANVNVTRLQDILVLGGVQERLWVPKTGIGKTVYIIGSVILSVLIGFYLLYSITTLISYRYELRELEKMER